MRNFINIDKTSYINAINLELGLYFPLKGFVTLENYESILSKKKIDKINFTIPINLFCSKTKFNKLKIGETVNLKYKKEIIGFINLESKFIVKKFSFLRSIFGTTSTKHLGVKNYSKKLEKNPFSLGGKVFLNRNKVSKFFKINNFDTIRKLKKIKNRDAAFSTRNIPHIGHNLIQKKIIENKKNLSIFLILSIKNKYTEKVLLGSYKALKLNKIFKNINILFIHFPTFFAGPNEAFLQAKIFENLKFKSFYVGRDHAGYKSFYNKFDAQKIFKKIKSKIKIIKLNEPMMCSSCKVAIINKYQKKKTCPLCQGHKLSELNGTDIKILIKRKKADILLKLLDPFVFSFFKKKNFSLQNE